MRIMSFIAVLVLMSALAAPASAGIAEDCVQGRDLDLSIGGCTAVIRSGQWQGKDLAWAYFERGNAYYGLGEPRLAIEDYDEALRLDPGHAHAYSGRAWMLYLLGRNAEALGDVDRSLSLDPGYATAIDTRAHVLAALGRGREALGEFERVMQTAGADWVRHYQGALIGHQYYSGAIDGAYGPQTRAALVACLEAGCRVLE